MDIEKKKEVNEFVFFCLKHQGYGFLINSFATRFLFLKGKGFENLNDNENIEYKLLKTFFKELNMHPFENEGNIEFKEWKKKKENVSENKKDKEFFKVKGQIKNLPKGEKELIGDIFWNMKGEIFTLIKLFL